jgi:hypothetical protein
MKMADAALGSAFLGAAINLGTTLYNNEKGFSARHEQAYDSQITLTQRLVEGFTKAHQDGDVDDEDHDTFIRLRDEYAFSQSDIRTMLTFRSGLLKQSTTMARISLNIRKFQPITSPASSRRKIKSEKPSEK